MLVFLLFSAWKPSQHRPRKVQLGAPVPHQGHLVRPRWAGQESSRWPRRRRPRSRRQSSGQVDHHLPVNDQTGEIKLVILRFSIKLCNERESQDWMQTLLEQPRFPFSLIRAMVSYKPWLKCVPREPANLLTYGISISLSIHILA